MLLIGTIDIFSIWLSVLVVLFSICQLLLNDVFTDSSAFMLLNSAPVVVMLTHPKW